MWRTGDDQVATRLLARMSNSLRRSPFMGVTTAASDKIWKRQMSRRARRLPPDAAQPRSGDRASPKDGKQRFDPRLRPDLLRK